MRSFGFSLMIFFTCNCISAVAEDNSLGTWRLNTAKSKYDSSLAAFASPAISRQARKKGIEVIGSERDGKQVRLRFCATYDGTPVKPARKIRHYERISLMQLNANTFSTEYLTHDGKLSAWERTLVSPSGLTMTVALSGTDSQGREIRGTFVYERCGRGANLDCAR